MPVDVGFAHASDRLLFAAVLVYAVAMLAYAAAFAFGRTGRKLAADAEEAELRAVGRASKTVAAAQSATAERVLVGAGAPLIPDAPRESAAPVGPVFGDGSTLEPRTGTADRFRRGQRAAGGGDVPADRSTVITFAGRIAVALTIIGWGLHISSVICRGFAAHRAPWGNMYEFSSMIALVAVTAYLVLMLRYPVRDLGVFIMIPVVTYLGIAGTELYVPAGPLVPALHSYWIVIHVFAAISATGIFMVSAVANVLFLVRDRYDRVLVSGGEPRFTRFARSLPGAKSLDTLSYRLAAFGFPIWTFAIIAGAIWAESAWGRYWGWDPKETWSFITWVVFACYLHARATAGWKGRRASYLALVGFGCFLFDFYGVNIWISGLHSYAGL
jgi:cytochrome c-type biogenesis protein CcsB